MPTTSERSADIALLLDFDGTLYVGDLPVLAYARHCAESLSDHDATALIDNVRFFLEGKSVGHRIVDLGLAHDGYEAVEILGRAAGLTGVQLSVAYLSSRRDLAGSAFALDAPDGLIALLEGLSHARVTVVTNADPLGVHEVLDALELTGHLDEVVTDAGKPASMPGIIQATLQRISATDQPSRLMVVGDRWDHDLFDAHRLGAATAMVDRFGRTEGTPLLRAPDLAGLINGIQDWADGWR